jgi:hypothetical protein
MRRGLEGANFFGYSLAHYYVFGRHRPGVTDVWEEFPARRAEHGYDLKPSSRPRRTRIASARKLWNRGQLVCVAPSVRPNSYAITYGRFEDCGRRPGDLLLQAGKNRHEHIMEALELFGREVLPEFKERDEKRTAEKEARLEPVIEQVLARKPAEDHPPLPADDYAFPAIPRAMADRFGNDQFHQMLDDFAEQSALATGGLEGLLNQR